MFTQLSTRSNMHKKQKPLAKRCCQKTEHQNDAGIFTNNPKPTKSMVTSNVKKCHRNRWEKCTKGNKSFSFEGLRWEHVLEFICKLAPPSTPVIAETHVFFFASAITHVKIWGQQFIWVRVGWFVHIEYWSVEQVHFFWNLVFFL